jgi:hypothetical protein
MLAAPIDADPDPTCHFDVGPDPNFTSMLILIWLLIKVMRICIHWPEDPPRSFRCSRMSLPKLLGELSQLPKFIFFADPDPVLDFDADPDRTFHFDANPDPSSKMIRIRYNAGDSYESLLQ